MSDGFLGRWSRRKLEVKEGIEVPPAPVVEAVTPISPPLLPRHEASTEAEPLPAPPAPPAPTIEEARALTPDSDFRRFAAQGVAPEVKNAAMKKLFSDPRYNVMDGLDIYTGDYSQPDPLPQSMLRQLASAKFLGFFADEEGKKQDGPSAPLRDAADDPTSHSVAQCEAAPPAVPESHHTHADADLRLQQDDAAAGEDPGRGIGREPDSA